MKIKKWIMTGAGIAILILVAIVVWKTWPHASTNTRRETGKIQNKNPGSKKLSLSSVEGAFVETKGLGKVFVINGLVRNEYSHPVRFIRMEAFLQTDDENILKRLKVYAGNPLTPNEIEALTPEELQRTLNNKMGKSHLNEKIAPNNSIPFTIVFTNLPPNLSQYTVKVLGSEPLR